MTVIEAENLSKVFKVPRKDPGVAGAVKALFRPRYNDDQDARFLAALGMTYWKVC